MLGPAGPSTYSERKTGIAPSRAPHHIRWYNGRGLMNDWRSKTGKHAERAKQASLEAYRKALKSIRTRAPGWRAKLPSDRVGWIRVGLIALAVFLALVVSGSGVVASMALAFNRRLPGVSGLVSPPRQGERIFGAHNEPVARL